MLKVLSFKKLKYFLLTFSILFVLFLLFNSQFSSARVCAPLDGYLVWSGRWESGKIPMASSSTYVLTASPFYVYQGKVGLNTTNPVYTLQVNGDISGNRLCIGNDCRSSWPSGGSGTINASNVSSGTFGANTGGGNYSFPGNVGIGTTVPVYPLHVVLPDNGSLNSIMFEGLRTALGGHAVRLELNAPNSPAAANKKNFQIININPSSTGGENRLDIRAVTDEGTYVATLLSMNHSGNVGIGTTNPTQRLDVIGFVRGSQGLCIGNDCRTSWPDGGTSSGYWAANGANIYNTNNGNVGIGTTEPTTKLDVNGGALFRSAAGGTTGHVKILSSPSVAGKGGLLLTQVADYTAGTGAFKLYTTDTGGLSGNLHIAHVDQGTPDAVTNLVTIQANGNVGIGITNPRAKLDVAGHISQSACPPGQTYVPGGFCIDTLLRGAATMPFAAVDCIARGGRVCTYGELTMACLTGKKSESDIGAGIWIGNNAGDDQAYCGNRADCENFEGICNKNDRRYYWCCYGPAGGGGY